MSGIIEIKTISEAHRLLNLDKPLHPLVSVFKHSKDMNLKVTDIKIFFNFYVISLKSDIKGSVYYGRNSYDFEEGTMLFSAPRQVFKTPKELEIDLKGWTVLIHPDFFLNKNIYQTIHQYKFFSYDVSEALHVSDREKRVLTDFADNIKKEIDTNLDHHSQDIIIHNIEAILKYSQRFYDRQFFTRTTQNKDFVVQFEHYLNDYFETDILAEKGLPSLEECGKALNLSGHYLSDLLKLETGKTIKEHIHSKIIEKAKNKLLNSSISVKTLAYNLGFEYPQYFSRLFKSKTGISPSEYRRLN